MGAWSVELWVLGYVWRAVCGLVGTVDETREKRVEFEGIVLRWIKVDDELGAHRWLLGVY